MLLYACALANSFIAVVSVLQECLNSTYGLGHFERAYKASAADIYTAHKLIKVRGRLLCHRREQGVELRRDIVCIVCPEHGIELLGLLLTGSAGQRTAS